MKKRVVLLVIVCILFITALAAGQEKPDIFVKTVPIIKIYPHKLGYRVVYETNTMDLHDIYIPLEWFRQAGGKAQIVWGRDPAYPYLSVFWKEGEFSHIRLYLDEKQNPKYWGDLKPGQFNDKFTDKETLDLKF